MRAKNLEAARRWRDKQPPGERRAKRADYMRKYRGKLEANGKKRDEILDLEDAKGQFASPSPEEGREEAWPWDGAGGAGGAGRGG